MIYKEDNKTSYKLFKTFGRLSYWKLNWHKIKYINISDNIIATPMYEYEKIKEVYNKLRIRQLFFVPTEHDKIIKILKIVGVEDIKEIVNGVEFWINTKYTIYDSGKLELTTKDLNPLKHYYFKSFIEEIDNGKKLRSDII